MKNYCILFCLILTIQSRAQQFIPLWPDGAKPNNNGRTVKDSIANERIWKVGTPGLYAFPVPEAENKGTTVMICPGGGYERLSHIYNGFQMARWFNSIGTNAYVLIYRLPHQADLVNRETAAWQDAQRGMRLIRANAGAWKLKTDKIGVMGISAGGHLASTLAIHTEDISNINDSLGNISFRPDFMILVSPVITMGNFTHGGSKRNLLGTDTGITNVQRFSSELNVTPQTPPAFIVHAYNDNSVPVQNSLLFSNALIAQKINVSLHIFPQGAHAIKLRDNPGSVEYWSQLCEAWMNEMNFTTPVNLKK